MTSGPTLETQSENAFVLVTTDPALANVRVRPATMQDLPAIIALHRRAFGPGRYALTAYRVREGYPPVSPFCRVAEQNGKLIGAVRLTPIAIGSTPNALLLGPLAVEPPYVNKGLGRALIGASVKRARQAAIEIVILVGDTAYYSRFGFVPVPIGQIVFPGPVDPARIMACELTPGALTRYKGLVRAS